VVEADESDASFLHLQPAIAVVTNIDVDHMETYGHSLSRLKGTFIDFLERLPFYGAAVVCADDQGVRDIVPLLSKRVVTYGTGDDLDVRAIGARHLGGEMRFTAVRSKKMLHRNQRPELEVTLNLPGLHNVLNACAAIGIALELGLDDEAVLRALSTFQGVGRRLQRFGEVTLRKGCAVSLVDDYGHHPAEMRVTLEALRGAYPGRRLVLVFQPHRYTRTRDLFDSFIEVLTGVDELILTEVYPAGESPIAGADGKSLHRALRRSSRTRTTFVPDVADLPAAIRRVARDSDVVVTMGAGSIGSVAGTLVSKKAE
jgi:UDP-N-acetylmuramate--alanine ligase